MGDEHGMSEISAVDHGTAEGAQSAEQSRGPMTAIVGVLLIGAIVVVALMSAALRSPSLTESETETDDAERIDIPGGSSGGGTPAAPPSSEDLYTFGPTGQSEATTTATMTTTTTITPPPTPPKMLMCTTRYPGPENDPPMGLCDIVLYDTRGTDISPKPPVALTAFENFCRATPTTMCGLNIEIVDEVLPRLGDDSVKEVMGKLYAAQIRHYGVLRSEISSATTLENMTDIISILAKLKAFQTGSNDPRDYILWGVTLLMEGRASVPDSMKQVFQEVLSAVRVDILVYQTTFAKNGTETDPFCVSTGPAMWDKAPTKYQTTFVDTFNFRNAVHLPPGTAEVLALTLCGEREEFAPGASAVIGYRKDCKSIEVGYVEQYVCSGGSHDADYVLLSLYRDSLQYVIIKQDTTRVLALDHMDTMAQKVCMASLDYGFNGGWVVHSLQCQFGTLCEGRNKGGFPRVREVLSVMNKTHTTCDFL